MNSTATPSLTLPFLQAGQALKNITHNDALNRLDAGLYLSCSDMGADSLPADPASGSAVIISDTAVPDLSDRVGQIAVFQAGNWVWFNPQSGWMIWDSAGDRLRVFNGVEWVSASPNFTPETLPHLGLNALANPAQRLSVASETSLFNHDGEGHRLTLNRATEADTASLIFQTNFAGEAELGLTGAAGFSLKTSSDGIAFSDRLTTPENYKGIQSPAFGSQRVTVGHDAAVMIQTPATGGIIALTVVSDNGFPQVGHSGLLAYDTGNSPGVISLATTGKLENHGASVLDGTVSADGNIGISAVAGGLYIENRIANPRDISVTFLC